MLPSLDHIKKGHATYKNAIRFFMIIKRLRMTNVMLHYLYLVVENYVVGGKKSRLMFFLLSRQAYLVELYFFSSV